MFLPTSKKEMQALGWERPEIILVTGDTYIDSPHIGVAVIGNVLADAGYRVAVIAQPDIKSDTDIAELGEPLLFWGVTAGCVDSMISNYTATKKKRQKDDLTAGGQNNKRPDLASIAYTNLIRRYFKHTKPIILGGIEASLQRISHYNYWSNSVRRSILFDAKADILVYGMGEKTILELAGHLKDDKPVTDIRGICYISKEKRKDYIELPSHQEAVKDKAVFTQMFDLFYRNNDPGTARGLCQKQDTRYLIHNPPQVLPTSQELDHIYELDYERAAHPKYKSAGPVRALDTIRFSIVSHRGCFGECNFCSIAVHQGKKIVGRSEASILREAQTLTRHPAFKGIISDVGGPTANMYGATCGQSKKKGACTNKRCLAPEACKNISVSHKRQIHLLRKLRQIPKVKKVFIGSGIRYDLILNDTRHGVKYLEEIITHHISGQLKIAPEHSEPDILSLMGKPGIEKLKKFVELFNNLNRKTGKKQFLTYYFIAAYPGSTVDSMKRLKRFTREFLKFRPRQIQVFTPSPSTYATLMYYTEQSIGDKNPLFVEKDNRKKEKQKQLVIADIPHKKRGK